MKYRIISDRFEARYRLESLLPYTLVCGRLPAKSDREGDHISDRKLTDLESWGQDCTLHTHKNTHTDKHTCIYAHVDATTPYYMLVIFLETEKCVFFFTFVSSHPSPLPLHKASPSTPPTKHHTTAINRPLNPLPQKTLHYIACH